MVIYQNNDVDITAEVIDTYEVEIKANGECLIVISRSELDDFARKLEHLLDDYRI